MKEIFPTAMLQIQENGGPIDPGFTYPDDQPAVPPPFMDDIDPGFSVMPPVYPEPPVPPLVPMPNPPCLFCSNDQWALGSVRMLNGAAGYNAFNIFIDNQPAYYGFDFAEVTPYRQLTLGYHVFTVTAQNGYIYLRRSIYIGDGMATIAINNSAGGLELTSISDSACPTGMGFSCFRVCNLAYYSGSVNVVLGNLFFNSIGVNQVSSFSRVRSGNYNLTVARSARPGIPLVGTNVNLNSNRVYTLYVLNWNQSSDTIRTLLVEDRRG